MRYESLDNKPVFSQNCDKTKLHCIQTFEIFQADDPGSPLQGKGGKEEKGKEGAGAQTKNLDLPQRHV
jgi:hypothetical protein